MQYREVLGKIAKLVGYEFSEELETTDVKFERIALEGGEVFITNQVESELTIGDTIYVETEEGFELAPAGSHTLEDGREIVLDEESVLVEVREEGEEEVVVEGEAEEEVEASEDILKIDELKTAIHDLLMAFESHSKEMENRFSTLEADYNEFKQSAEYKPLKEETKLKQTFAEMRLELINKMKNK
jgi:hypothetical protein